MKILFQILAFLVVVQVCKAKNDLPIVFYENLDIDRLYRVTSVTKTDIKDTCARIEGIVKDSLIYSKEATVNHRVISGIITYLESVVDGSVTSQKNIWLETKMILPKLKDCLNFYKVEDIIKEQIGTVATKKLMKELAKEEVKSVVDIDVKEKLKELKVLLKHIQKQAKEEKLTLNDMVSKLESGKIKTDRSTLKERLQNGEKALMHFRRQIEESASDLDQIRLLAETKGKVDEVKSKIKKNADRLQSIQSLIEKLSVKIEDWKKDFLLGDDDESDSDSDSDSDVEEDDEVHVQEPENSVEQYHHEEDFDDEEQERAVEDERTRKDDLLKEIVDEVLTENKDDEDEIKALRRKNSELLKIIERIREATSSDNIKDLIDSHFSPEVKPKPHHLVEEVVAKPEYVTENPSKRQSRIIPVKRREVVQVKQPKIEEPEELKYDENLGSIIFDEWDWNESQALRCNRYNYLFNQSGSDKLTKELVKLVGKLKLSETNNYFTTEDLIKLESIGNQLAVNTNRKAAHVGKDVNLCASSLGQRFAPPGPRRMQPFGMNSRFPNFMNISPPQFPFARHNNFFQ